MPATLKPSFQRQVATQVSKYGAIALWLEQNQEAVLLRPDGRRYFGQGQSSVFRARQTWLRRRGLSNL